MDASASDGLRIQRVQDLLRSVAEVYGQQASVDLLSQLNRLALTRFWTAALEDALDRPLSAAYLVGVLIDESTGLMPESEIQALADEVVGLILETEPSDHRILRPVISRLIEQANDSQLQRWSQRLRMLQHSEAAEFVASCLARRAGIPREFGPPDDVARELDRLHYHSRPGPAAGWLQHNAELDSLMVKIRNLVPESRSRSPQQIAYIVHGVQANLRLIAAFHEQDGAGGEPAEQLPLLTNFQIHESAEEQSFPAPSPSQLRELERMIERLKNSRNDQLATRESALKRLAVLADAVEDVTMEQATSLAAWVLEEGHAESEALVLEQVMPQLSHWPRLIMAIADRLESADVPLDTALTLFNRITEQTFEMPRDADWKSVMQQELLKYAAARIHRRSLAPDTSEQRDWNRLQKYVLQTRDPRQWLVERIELASENGGPSFSKQRSRQRVPFSAIAQDNQRWRFVLVESERVDSMQQWTMQSRVLFEWVEQKIERLAGPGDERVRNLKRRFQDEALSCSNMGELLGQTEWHLLEALNLWRNVLIEQAGSERGADGS